jgi:hypothetical protein
MGEVNYIILCLHIRTIPTISIVGKRNTNHGSVLIINDGIVIGGIITSSGRTRTAGSEYHNANIFIIPAPIAIAVPNQVIIKMVVMSWSSPIGYGASHSFKWSIDYFVP